MRNQIEDFDIFIIGGGIAGLNTAKLLSLQNNHKIGLADRSRSKKNNPARLTFKDIVIKNNLDDCVLAEYDSFGILSYHGARSVHHFEEPKFVALNYNKACDKILTQLKAKKNVYHFGERAVDVNIDSDYVEIIFYSGLKIRTRVLVDASGKSHFILNMLNLKKPTLYSHSFGQSFNNCQINNVNEAYFICSSVDYGSGGGWYYPINQKNASVGFALITDDVKYPTREIKEKYFRGIKEVKPICNYFKNAQPVNYEIGTIPIQPVEKITMDRVLIVGDAAGQATSWMCMGVEPALKNSEFASGTISQAFDKNDFSESVLYGYKEQWNKKNKKIFDDIEKQKVKIWFLGEDVWDFILKMDLPNLSSQQLYERIKYNGHLMSKPKALIRWVIFIFKNFYSRKKYKQHTMHDEI